MTASPDASPKRRRIAILFADIAGYSRSMQHDEEGTYHRVARALDLFRTLVGDYGGRVVDTAGDGVFAVFEEAGGALRFAIEIQREFRNDAVWSAAAERLAFRIGIHAGEPEAAEAVLRPLLKRELPPTTRQNASRNLALALMRQQRFADALKASEAAGDEWPDDPVRAMNLCFASARLGDVTLFNQNARLLISIQQQSPTERVQTWIDTMLGPLAADAGLSNAGWKELAAEMGSPGMASNTPSGNREEAEKKGEP
jgi:tetratricopeptide (TPR) repeat protein